MLSVAISFVLAKFVANVIATSLISTTVELTVCCVPSTFKLPLIITVPVLSPYVNGSIIKLLGPRSSPFFIVKFWLMSKFYNRPSKL